VEEGLVTTRRGRGPDLGVTPRAARAPASVGQPPPGRVAAPDAISVDIWRDGHRTVREIPAAAFARTPAPDPSRVTAPGRHVARTPAGVEPMPRRDVAAAAAVAVPARREAAAESAVAAPPRRPPAGPVAADRVPAPVPRTPAAVPAVSPRAAAAPVAVGFDRRPPADPAAAGRRTPEYRFPPPRPLRGGVLTVGGV
jgi:hypothetical protein